MTQGKRIGILVAAAVLLWLARGRKPASAELAQIEAQLLVATVEEEAALLARKAELEAILIEWTIKDAAAALYGVAPLDSLKEGDLALAEAARQMILAGDYNMEADGTYISSIPRGGESTAEFAARAKREKEAYRVYQMSQSEYYREKWGLEPITKGEAGLTMEEASKLTAPGPGEVFKAEVATLEAEIADQLGISAKEAATMTAEELLAAETLIHLMTAQESYIEQGAVVATVEATLAAASEAVAEYAAIAASPTASASEVEAARINSVSTSTTAQIVQSAASAGITVYTTGPTGAR